MASVSNLKINFQSGSNNTYYATWTFEKPESSSSSGSIKKGSLVTIKSGATWYNGVVISSWVFGQKWIVTQVTGDRAVLGKNLSGSNNINSPINVKYLVNVGTATRSTRAGESAKDDTFDHYEVKWYYDSGDSTWFEGSSTTTTVENAVYSAPDNALAIKVSVTPVSKTYEVNDQEASYWTGTPVTAEYLMITSPPQQPSTPTVEINKYKLTAKLENIDDGRADKIHFEVYRGSDVAPYKSGIATVLTRRASFTWSIEAGSDYRVRCAAINLYGNSNLYSEWSDYSDSVGTMPSTPSRITRIRANSTGSVILEWSKVANATSYEVEYATKKEYFDSSDATSTVNNITTTRYEFTGLESGSEYFFRVRAVNDNGESGWTSIKSVVVGKKPAAPTTWSSTTTAIVGEPLVLYWVHNSEDGSSQVQAELEIYYNDQKETQTIKNSTDEDEKDKTSFYNIDTTKYSEGTKIKWRVRTSGVTGEYGDWSVQREIDIYSPPVASLKLYNQSGSALTTLSSFPFRVTCSAGPDTQNPIGFSLIIKANSSYQTVDDVGRTVMVNAGDEVYSKYFDISEDLDVTISAGDVNLQNNVSYTVVCTASMDSGLTDDAEVIFDVSWETVEHDLDASISVDTECYVAYVSPYATEDPDGDILLSVYRREFDGSFTELATDVENNTNTWILDPHPSLDYARYRIVGRSKTTGAVMFYDCPGKPVGCNSIIIQWDDEWTDFNVEEGDAMETKPWTGSMLKIPYNIDVQDGNTPDVSLVEYIGRSNPVSYYGTQLGSSSTWSVEIPKRDKDTLYALRRLAIWMGDVYVREPSGSGYWANLTVSYSQKHCEVTIPVTFSLKRVEGGV